MRRKWKKTFSLTGAAILAVSPATSVFATTTHTVSSFTLSGNTPKAVTNGSLTQSNSRLDTSKQITVLFALKPQDFGSIAKADSTHTALTSTSYATAVNPGADTLEAIVGVA